MKRSLAAIPLVFLLLFAAPARAAAPATNADVLGIELCAQFMCGSAIFTGILQGEVAGVQTSLGTFFVSVTHEDLPTQTNDTSDITGGTFELRAGTRTVRGIVLGGTLTLVAPDLFAVHMVLAQRNGSRLVFDGFLSHSTFPPTISGHISSIP